jgi:hypothetical protein
VRLPHRSRQGIVLGLDGWQLTFLIAAAAVLLIGVNRFGPPGLLYALPIYVPLGATALITVHGLSAPKMLGLWLSKQVRHTAGATTHRYRPEQSHLESTLNLPGTRASVQLWDVDGMASAYHPGERTVSITAELEVQGFLMKDAPERLDLAQQWAPVLASLTQRPGIKRVTLQERTTRTTIRPARDHYETASRKRMVDPAGPAAANYREVLDASEPFAVGHRNYLTLTLDLVALGAQLKALGGGKQAIQALSAVEAGNLAEALRAAKITVRAWLGGGAGAHRLRPGVDPGAAQSHWRAVWGGPGGDRADVSGGASRPQWPRLHRVGCAHHDVDPRMAPLGRPGGVPRPAGVCPPPGDQRSGHAHPVDRGRPGPGRTGAEEHTG